MQVIEASRIKSNLIRICIRDIKPLEWWDKKKEEEEEEEYKPSINSV